MKAILVRLADSVRERLRTANGDALSFAEEPLSGCVLVKLSPTSLYPGGSLIVVVNCGDRGVWFTD
jgi:hypothetical protein